VKKEEELKVKEAACLLSSTSTKRWILKRLLADCGG
jgi:hypothetical protein